MKCKKVLQPTIHKQVLVKGPDFQAEVDEGLAPLISLIWQLEIRIVLSCEENQPGIAWIGFLSERDASLFLGHCLVFPRPSARYDVFELLWHRIMRSGVPDRWQYRVEPRLQPLRTTKGTRFVDFDFSIRFPKSDIPLLIEHLTKALKKKERESRPKANGK